MHELSISLNIIDVVSRSIRGQKVDKVNKIYVSLGTLSGISKESLLFCWDIAAKKSLLGKAKLIISKKLPVIYCDNCQKETLIHDDFILKCCKCGKPSATIISGRELIIDKITINYEAKNSKNKKGDTGKK